MTHASTCPSNERQELNAVGSGSRKGNGQIDTERKEIGERHSVGEGEDFGKRLGSCRHKSRSATL